MAESHARLNKINNVGDTSITPAIRDNLVEFFDWAILDAGGFFNVNVPTEGFYGGDKHKLRVVDDPNYTLGQVWEGFRSNWVWQSGLSCSDQPLVVQQLLEDSEYPLAKRSPGISGVFIGSTFQPVSGVGDYSHHINYPAGRVIFDSAISTSSDVKVEFSYKWVNVIPANNEFFREIQYRSQRADGDFTLVGSGDWSQLGETRLQLPAIAVEPAVRRTQTPYNLGSSTSYVASDVLFHVLAEDDFTRDKLVDMVSLQGDKTIFMFDSDRIGRKDDFPLDYRGMVAASGQRYPELVAPSGEGGSPGAGKGYRVGELAASEGKFDNLRLAEARVTTTSALSPSLYHGVVRITTEAII